MSVKSERMSKPNGDAATSSSTRKKRAALALRASQRQLGSRNGSLELTMTQTRSTKLSGLPESGSRTGEHAQLLFRFVQEQDQRELDRLHSRLGFRDSYDVETGEVIELTPKGAAAAETFANEPEDDIEDQSEAL